jgi:sterol desaturase/sphingolipid hydroxylase (fatty acid hydroxylase superfamily)
MDDLQFGTRDKRGNWAPSAVLQVAPFWRRPFSLPKILAWLPGYFWPWNAFHMATALLWWAFVIPDVATLQILSWGWALWLYAINATAIFVMYGAIELFWYVRKKQGTRFKFNHKFPAEQPSDVFWFKSQNLDNFLRSMFCGIPIWTAVEVLVLWAYANSWGTWLTWGEHWPWLIALTLLVPAIHEIHFFCIHRLIHSPLLYKYVHSVHHNSINPSPWSSLSMHPVEHLLYFGEMFWHLILPTNPVVAVNGHIGFDRLELTETTALDSHAYVHYLHHKYFEVNYGGDGLIPLDKWFGSWHDGTKAADERMKDRFRKKKDRLNAKKGTGIAAE